LTSKVHPHSPETPVQQMKAAEQVIVARRRVPTTPVTTPSLRKGMTMPDMSKVQNAPGSAGPDSARALDRRPTRQSAGNVLDVMARSQRHARTMVIEPPDLCKPFPPGFLHMPADGNDCNNNAINSSGGNNGSTTCTEDEEDLQEWADMRALASDYSFISGMSTGSGRRKSGGAAMPWNNPTTSTSSKRSNTGGVTHVASTRSRGRSNSIVSPTNTMNARSSDRGRSKGDGMMSARASERSFHSVSPSAHAHSTRGLEESPLQEGDKSFLDKLLNDDHDNFWFLEGGNDEDEDLGGGMARTPSRKNAEQLDADLEAIMGSTVEPAPLVVKESGGGTKRKNDRCETYADRVLREQAHREELIKTAARMDIEDRSLMLQDDEGIQGGAKGAEVDSTLGRVRAKLRAVKFLRSALLDDDTRVDVAA